jgi:uridylate kinase
MNYKRVLLKISGEQLAGKFESGIDADRAHWLAKEVKDALKNGVQLVIMVGGGNFVRGAQIAGSGIKRVTGDHMGMLGTLINALALTDIFESDDIPTRCVSNIFASQVAEPFSHRLAEKHLQNGRVVIVAGGIGRPYVTTDTAAISLALELGCEVVLKSTKVDGIYSKDPEAHDDAVKYEELDYQHAVENEGIKVMDKAALGLAMEQKMPLIVLSLEQDGSLQRALSGEKIGTKVS